MNNDLISCEIKKILPNFPDEIIKLWLLPFALKLGWPPEKHERWSLILAEKPIEFWRNIKWEKKEIDLSKTPFSAITRGAIKGIADAYLFGKNNNYWRELGKNGKQRFYDAYKYIAKNGILPKPLILLTNESNDYDVVDGNHRLLAFLAIKKIYDEYNTLSENDKIKYCPPGFNKEFRFSSIQKVWIAKK